MEQRLLFVIDHLQRRDSVSALCERYGISRKTGYKWIERYANEGLNGLNERSRCRHDQERIAYPIRQAVLQLRGHGGTELGPKKIQKRLAERFGEAEVPSRTTIYNILKAAGRIEPRHKRRRFYNEERPHEALSQRTPHSCYTSSNREYPARLPEMSYPSYMETHRVSTNGLLKRRNVVMYVGHLLHGELVGLEAIEEGLWHVHFGPIVIGGIDERKPHKRYLSLKVLPM
ncbi:MULTISPECIES: helix-turn-helix domain-containing protein [Cupriavidus]|nr:helix-turn-helix domain-containing protein [Cupriavidus taiwanensis]